MKKILYAFIILVNSLYLTELVDNYTINSKLQFLFVLTYFIFLLMIIAFIFTKYLKSKDLMGFSRRGLCVSIALSVLIIAAGGENFNNHKYHDSTISITSLGEKNIKSKSTEVWITGIIIDSKPVDMKNIPLNPSWQFKDNALINTKNQPSTQDINLSEGKDIKIVFTKHPWSGKIQIKDGVLKNVVDLYSLEGSSYVYQVKSNSSQPPFILVLFDYLMATIVLSCVFYNILKLTKIKKGYFSIVIFLIFLFSFNEKLNLDETSYYILLVTSIILGFIFLSILSKINNSIYKTKPNMLILIVINTIISFGAVGNTLFFSKGYLMASFQDFCIFVLINLLLIPYCITFLYLVDFFGNKQKIEHPNIKGNHFRLWSLLFVCMSIIGIIYLYAFNPANMSLDSVSQWKQALGLVPFSDWHPVFYTLTIKLISYIFPSPALVAIAQIIFSSCVISSFLILFYKYGIPKKVLILFAVIFALLPNNGANLVTLWKDIPYTISLLWLTLVVAKIQLDGKKFTGNLLGIANLIAALTFVYLFRHNGVVPVILTATYLVYYGLRNRDIKVIVSIFVSIAIILSVKVPLYKELQVIPNPKGVQYVTPIHGLASVLYHKGEVSADTMLYMNSIMPKQKWIELYNPYSANPYMFGNSYNLVGKLSQTSTMEVISMYLKELINNPIIVGYDRLTGLDLVWNFSIPNNGYDYRFESNLLENNLGITRDVNKLTSVVYDFMIKTTENGISDSVLWRGALYTFMILLLLFYIFITRNWGVIFCFIPVLGNLFSLFLSMSWQDYRYVYFEFYNYWFLLGIVVIHTNMKSQKNSGGENVPSNSHL